MLLFSEGEDTLFFPGRQSIMLGKRHSRDRRWQWQDTI